MAVSRINDKIPAGPLADERQYNMNHRRRGRAIIFDHYEFLDRYDQREGNDKDEERLSIELSELGFEVEIIRDPKVVGIKKALDKEAKLDHSDADCLVIVVLSHGREVSNNMNDSQTVAVGSKSYELMAMDDTYNELELFQPFSAEKCPSLRGKPKMFFINACHGNRYETKHQVKAYKCHKDGSSENKFLYSIPDCADFLLVHATSNGTYSIRDKIDGTLFIQSLCDELEENRTRDDPDDMLTLLTSVNKRVGLTDVTIKGQIFGQMQFVVTTLMRSVYLRPKLVIKDELANAENPLSIPSFIFTQKKKYKDTCKNDVLEYLVTFEKN